MGSASDLSVMNEAAEFLKKLQIPYEITIVSAHRTPERMFDYAKNAHAKGIKVIIAGAGGAAHGGLQWSDWGGFRPEPFGRGA